LTHYRQKETQRKQNLITLFTEEGIFMQWMIIFIISFGNTKDGGTVGLKVSDRTQAEIDKVSVIAKRGAHLI
jgi:hypothetical protein